MSHFTRIKTTMVEKGYLLQALRDLGYTPEEGDPIVHGWGGQTVVVEIKIPTGNPHYDLGFRSTPEGYEVVADWWGIRNLDRSTLIQSLTRQYAYHATVAKLQDQGFTLVETERQPDECVHLVLRRSL